MPTDFPLISAGGGGGGNSLVDFADLEDITVSSGQTLLLKDKRSQSINNLTVKSNGEIVVEGVLSVYGSITENGTISGRGTLKKKSL